MMVKSKVKYIQSLSQKKQRDEEGVFVAEGPKIINDLLASNLVQVQELFAVPEWLNANPQHAGNDRLNIEVIDDPMLSRLSFLTTPNQVVGIFRKQVVENFNMTGRLTLMTDNIQDPGNMGSIIRCADWFGITQMICSRECTDVYGPKTVQAAMGSIGRVKVAYRDLAEVISQNPSIRVYAATLDGQDILKMPAVKEGMIIIGNESKGIGPEILKMDVQKITIPRIGDAESLNAAVATGIILSQLTRS